MNGIFIRVGRVLPLTKKGMIAVITGGSVPGIPCLKADRDVQPRKRCAWDSTDQSLSIPNYHSGVREWVSMHWCVMALQLATVALPHNTLCHH